MADVTTVGFLGPGQLGEPMIRRLLGAGWPVLAFARRAEVQTRLKDAGASLVRSVAELAGRSDILISCLFSDAQLLQTGLGPDGFIAHAKADGVFVSHTTGSPATLMALKKSSSSAPAIVDAPVSGTAERIADGKLTVLIGGDKATVERVRPILSAYADPMIPTGELGTALHIKLVNNVLFAANAQLVAAAGEVGRRLGVVPDALLKALLACSGGSYAAAYADRNGGVEAFPAAAGPFLRKDVAAAVAVAEQVGADLGLLGAVIESGPLRLTEGLEAQ